MAVFFDTEANKEKLRERLVYTAELKKNTVVCYRFLTGCGGEG